MGNKSTYIASPDEALLYTSTEADCETVSFAKRNSGYYIVAIGTAATLTLVNPLVDIEYKISPVYIEYDNPSTIFERLPDAFYSFLMPINYNKTELRESILSFISLSADWDGYGALPLAVPCAMNALSILDGMADYLSATIDAICPTPNGTISLNWENSLKDKVAVEVGKNTMSYYVKKNGGDIQVFNKKDINALSVEELSTFVNSLFFWRV